MLLGGLQKLSLIDYPGRVAATVFTVGCNFSCPFCHNPELVKVGSDRLQMYLPEEDFFEFLEQRQGLIEGICISGGEPTIHQDLPAFLEKIKSAGFLVKLDTNGTWPSVLKDLVSKKLVDYVAMDIKAPLERYHEIINAEVDLEKIHESVQLVRALPDYEFRTTVIPDFHKKEDFLSIARWLDGAKRYYIQQFKPENALDPAFAKMRPYEDQILAEFCQVIKPYFEICEVRV